MKLLKTVFIVLAATAALGACKTGKIQPTPTEVVKQVPSLNETLTTKSRGDRIRLFSTVNGSKKEGRVRVCLRNSASGRNKGLHFKKAKKPRFVVKKKNQISCAHYKPGLKTFRLWRTNLVGKWKHRRTVKVDLSKFAGQQVTFDWVQD